MKVARRGLLWVMLFWQMLSVISCNDQPKVYEHADAWRHFQGVGWNSEAVENLRYAQGAGFTYVFHTHQDLNLVLDYDADDRYKENLKYYFNDIHKTIQPEVELKLSAEKLKELREKWPFEFYWYPQLPRFYYYKRWQQIKEEYPEVFDAYKKTWEALFAWYDTKADFPYNISEMDSWGGYKHEASQRAKTKLSNTNFQAEDWSQFLPDFQQQNVVDYYIKNIIKYIKTHSDVPDKNYLFTGILIDVPELWRECNARNRTRPAGISSKLHDDIRHDYPNITEGWLYFLKHLKMGLSKAFSKRDIKFIYEPGDPPYRFISSLAETNLSSVDKEYISGDMILGEKTNIDRILNDERIFKTGWYTINDLGSSSPDIKGYDNNFQAGARIAQAGAWFIFYGMWQRLNIGTISVEAFDMDIKMSRLFVNWDNLNNVPLGSRLWNAESKTYKSTHSYADKNIVYSRKPGTNQIWAVFRNGDGKIQLRTGENVAAVKRVNGFWEVVGDGINDLKVNSSEIYIDPNIANEKKAYIIELTNR